ncbi:MAG: 16S rRNA (cytidine(1402)-2'-O)-methyltransferase [Pseudomonadota bacterium]
MAGQQKAEAVASLYVVATPIGNLADMSPRAVQTLRDVALIAAEDTRHTGRLLSHFGISTALMALHDHNEQRVVERVINRLRDGDAVALVSDAGTPLISDPGYKLLRAAVTAEIEVRTVPGPSAVTAALSVSGLPTDQFVFAGFLPARDDARQRFIKSLASETRTVVVFESVHRIEASLTAFSRLLPARRLTVHRELTKQYESAYRGSASELLAALNAGELVARGEFVFVIAAAADDAEAASAEVEITALLRVLLAAMPLKQAVAEAVTLTGRSRNQLYEQALAINNASNPER